MKFNILSAIACISFLSLYLRHQNAADGAMYATGVFIVGFSLILGWWPKTATMRCINLFGLVAFACFAITQQQNPIDINLILAATIAFIVPALFTMGLRTVLQKISQPSSVDIEALATKQPIEIVQMIDDSLNCLIGLNNIWIQNNWSKLDDEEKIVFINNHRERINKGLPYTGNTIDVIQLLQNISRGL